MSNQPLVDQAARDQALDITGSFIVQAPAGSGKTELLTLRYMRLLASCQQPEQVLAITFTRKAASEMRDRILNTLREAAGLDDAAFQALSGLPRLRMATARQVLAMDQQAGWRLLASPSRLRIQTIDSFCHYLASQLPVLSGTGGNPNVAEDVQPCFDEAIENTLAQLESDAPLADDIALLLQHLDNDRNRVQSLLSLLLPNRDQWLGYIVDFGQSPEQTRYYLETIIAELAAEMLADCEQHLAPYRQELLTLYNYALTNLAAYEKSPITDFIPRIGFPAAELTELETWQQISDMLLTNKGDWRKTADVRSGFPGAGSGEEKQRRAEHKKRLLTLIGELNENEALRERLTELHLLPRPEFNLEQWRFTAALLRVMAALVAELQLAFRRYQVIDYPQTSAAALDALGSAEEPTDIALALDYRLQHILVDEFQDTSRVQLKLLQQLTSGWTPDDGRTLFLVGDAMQSCYGFRNANVGIYLDVRDRGINELQLTPLYLQANFRSQQRVVDWVNAQFGEAFPQTMDPSRGAVTYSPSVASHGPEPDYGIDTLLFSYEQGHKDDARSAEAAAVVARVEELRSADPNASIAILVRNRSHFTDIIPRLRSAGINWLATDIDRLDSVPVVQDLHTLTRALLNPADRLAWLALLRAPWCGLDGAALFAVANHAGSDCIWRTIIQAEQIAGLDADSRQRVAELGKILDFAMSLRHRLRARVEAAWTLLRGSACCQTAQDEDSAARYLVLLDEHETAGHINDLDAFEDRLSSTFISGAPALDRDSPADAGSVHLLTMHKAKGLEFDHVLLPGLAQGTRQEPKHLLQWHERLNRHGESRFFLAALTATGEDDDPLYQLLRHEQAIKQELESTRLLYIAVTRAIKSATLFATVEFKDDEPRPPRAQSLLARIWLQLQDNPGLVTWLDTAMATPVAAAPESAGLPEQITPLWRYSGGLQLTASEHQMIDQQLEALAGTDEPVDQEAAENFPAATVDPLAAAAGNLIHQALETAMRDSSRRLPELSAYWRRVLQRFSLSDSQLDDQLDFIRRSVTACLESDEHRWLFSNEHQDDQQELAVLSHHNGRAREFIIDRTLVDASGRRWIIDYKTATPAAEQAISEFVAEQEELYRGQLAHYRSLFAEMGETEIVTALFFTALPLLHEVAID